VASLVAEGVFVEFPDLRAMLIDSGITWLPAPMWRMTKDWKGVRLEVPWVKKGPRRHHRAPHPPDDAGGPTCRTIRRWWTACWGNGMPPQC
jgi:predicted TIM-barrel fold metal-dependent hydrolase